MKRTLQVLLLTAICLLGFTARLWNARDIFLEGRIYFVDPDCYSRMTRAKLIAEGAGLIIHHHDFEDWPAGVTPHTTAPLDWLILSGKRVADFAVELFDRSGTSIIRGQTLDVSGALIGPLLGAATCLIFGIAGLRLRWTGWAAPALFCAVSPVVVHGTVLGRPDHQALLIPLLALALIAELALARSFTRNWGITAGITWALALWTSLYEPLVMLGVVVAFWLVANRQRFTDRALRPGWIAFAAIFVGSLLIEGWRIEWPDAELRSNFANWQQTIGELAHLDPRAPLLYRWLGVGIILAPLALLAAIFVARRRGEWAAGPVLNLLLVGTSLALTVWQLRWGYFVALTFALALPTIFDLARGRRRIVTLAVQAAFLASLWPLAADWDEKLFPEDHPELDLDKQRGVVRLERVRLREVAEAMRSAERRPFVAPWWLSPALAYWSGQPGVAGSSHESLRGIVASSRLFLAPDAATAEHLVRELGVKWLVTDDSERMIDTSRILLGVPAPKQPTFLAHLHDIAEPRERVRAEDVQSASPEAREKLATLADRDEAEHLGSAAFSCVSTNQFYKLFAVKPITP